MRRVTRRRDTSTHLFVYLFIHPQLSSAYIYSIYPSGSKSPAGDHLMEQPVDNTPLAAKRVNTNKDKSVAGSQNSTSRYADDQTTRVRYDCHWRI